MAWKECSRVDQRVLLVSEFLKGEEQMAELCRAFGVSRKTAYKWVARYKDEGPAGLVDRSRAPLTHATRVAPVVLEALLEARRAHPRWGSRKVLAWLARKQPTLPLPAASTVSVIFAKYGLVRSKTARRRTPPYTDPFADADVPNRIWCADYKGHFRTRDGRRCYPLTVTDACSRMLLRCTALRSTRTRWAMPVFESVFREFGLPEKIRTDNGTPFASRGAGGLSQLSIWWTKLGIRHERIQPGHPEQNGRHERMHRTLKQETTRPPAPSPARSRRNSMASDANTTPSDLMKHSATRRPLRSTHLGFGFDATVFDGDASSFGGTAVGGKVDLGVPERADIKASRGLLSRVIGFVCGKGASASSTPSATISLGEDFGLYVGGTFSKTHIEGYNFRSRSFVSY